MKKSIKQVDQESNYGSVLESFKKIYEGHKLFYISMYPLKALYDIYKYYVLTDEAFIRLLYRRKFGRYPNLENPTLFSEKLQWLKLNDRTPLHTQCADKFRVREYVAKKIGKQYLIPLVFESDNVEDVREENFPDEAFILKQNHDSGWAMFIVRDKKKFDFKKARKEIYKALKKNYYQYSREWQYKNIKKHILGEKLLMDAQGNVPNDIKIHCFHGKVEFVEIMTGRGSKEGVKEHCLSKNGEKMPFLFSYPQSTQKLVFPSKWQEMMILAEELSSPFIYVRVDLYCVENKIYFGELTFTPHSGINMYLEPKEWDAKLGKLIDLSQLKV